jgi:uncharacterized protein
LVARMKKVLILIVWSLLTSIVSGQVIPTKPSPPRLVNDLANVLTAEQEQALESKLVKYDDSTSTQIVVLTVETIGGMSIEDYALEILRTWGVGNKRTNNGIVIVAAIQDRKMRIEVGYGLEGVVPDITAQHVIEEFLVPNFRQGNYYRGFDQAADALIEAAAGRYQAPENYRQGKGRPGGSLLLMLVVIFVIIMLISRGGRGGGGMASRRGFGRNIPPIWWLPTGGGSWGGGGGGWSGGGGGFGGFGGGSGGGGGASGSW